MACTSSRLLRRIYKGWDDPNYIYFVGYFSDGDVRIRRLHQANAIARFPVLQAYDMCLRDGEHALRMARSQSREFPYLLTVTDTQAPAALEET